MENSDSILSNRIDSKSGVWMQLRLNRPKALNALSIDMLRLIASELQRASEDPSVKGVILDSTIEKAFCAGGDVKGVVQELLAGNKESARSYFLQEYSVDYQVHSFEKPLVTWMNGYVFGGGVGLAVGSGYRIVTPQTLLAMPESKIGFFPDVGASLFLGRMPWPIGLFAAWSGYRFTPEDAVAYGLADFIIDQPYHSKLLQHIETIESEDTYGIKQELRSWLLNFRIEKESPLFETEFEKLKGISPDLSAMDCFNAFLELKSDKFFGPWVKQIESGSPTSLAMGFAQMKWAQKKREAKESFDISQALNAELALAEWAVTQNDFALGVKSLLIDKSPNVTWVPENLKSIDTANLIKILEENQDSNLIE